MKPPPAVHGPSARAAGGDGDEAGEVGAVGDLTAACRHHKGDKGTVDTPCFCFLADSRMIDS